MLAGLFTKRTSRAVRMRQQAEELYARLRDAKTVRAASGTPLRGMHRIRKGGPGHEFWQYRDFQTGDAARNIDWKQSGKSDRVLIRQKERETQKRTCVWLQNDAAMQFGTPAKYESGAIITLATAMLCASHHDPLILCGTGSTGGLDHLTGVLDDATYSPADGRIEGEEILLIADFLDPQESWQPLLDSIPSSSRLHVIQILDGAELDLPYDGHTLFEHPGTRSREQVLNAASIRPAYLERLQAQIDTVRQAARAQGGTYALLRSGDDPLDILLNLSKDA